MFVDVCFPERCIVKFGYKTGEVCEFGIVLYYVRKSYNQIS